MRPPLPLFTRFFLSVTSRWDGGNPLPKDASVDVDLTSPSGEEIVVGPDYFVERDGVRYAGAHLFLDFWGARNLTDPGKIEHALTVAAHAAGATILHSHFHQFGDSGGVSGVLVLAESHISIHTWPERDFAAIDIFMCGACDPYKSVPALRDAFRPANSQVTEQRRGLIR
jgi:S-adenosylmethionine decarboxylase